MGTTSGGPVNGFDPGDLVVVGFDGTPDTAAGRSLPVVRNRRTGMYAKFVVTGEPLHWSDGLTIGRFERERHLTLHPTKDLWPLPPGPWAPEEPWAHPLVCFHSTAVSGWLRDDGRQWQSASEPALSFRLDPLGTLAVGVGTRATVHFHRDHLASLALRHAAKHFSSPFGLKFSLLEEIIETGLCLAESLTLRWPLYVLRGAVLIRRGAPEKVKILFDLFVRRLFAGVEGDEFTALCEVTASGQDPTRIVRQFPDLAGSFGFLPADAFWVAFEALDPTASESLNHHHFEAWQAHEAKYAGNTAERVMV